MKLILPTLLFFIFSIKPYLWEQSTPRARNDPAEQCRRHTRIKLATFSGFRCPRALELNPRTPEPRCSAVRKLASNRQKIPDPLARQEPLADRQYTDALCGNLDPNVFYGPHLLAADDRLGRTRVAFSGPRLHYFS